MIQRQRTNKILLQIWKKIEKEDQQNNIYNICSIAANMWPKSERFQRYKDCVKNGAQEILNL